MFMARIFVQLMLAMQLDPNIPPNQDLPANRNSAPAIRRQPVIQPGTGDATNESVPADALIPEQIRQAVEQLDDTAFERREEAVDFLFAAGHCAVPALEAATDSPLPEIAVRAFDVLQRLYFRDDEPTYEAIDLVVQRLMHVGNLSAAARAEQLFESISEIRQTRAVARLERLGAIVHLSDSRFEQDRQRIDHVLFGRDWSGNDEDVRLIERIEDMRLANTAAIYVVRGVTISEATLLDLKAYMPSLVINRRGPAQLGVMNDRFRDGGCVIGQVVPDSAADYAGLKQGDQIVEIDGREVNSFEKLVEIIGEKEPGDLVPIVFIRREELHEVEAKLSAWSKKKVTNPIPQKQ